jgi:hypothetical protein
MPELTPDPDSTGGENQKNKNSTIFFYSRQKRYE